MMCVGSFQRWCAVLAGLLKQIPNRLSSLGGFRSPVHGAFHPPGECYAPKRRPRLRLLRIKRLHQFCVKTSAALGHILNKLASGT